MINGIVTALLLLAFIGIAVWAWSSRNRERFQSAAQLPLTDEPSCRCGSDGCQERTS